MSYHTWIDTHSGMAFDFANPTAKVICIEDIAIALSREFRFSNQSVNGTWSVASHSLWVADYLCLQGHGPLMQMHGLLHDAAEAYLKDIAAPLKRIEAVRSVIKPLEARIDEAIYESINLPMPSEDDHKVIKQADTMSLVAEKERFVLNQGRDWPTALPELDHLGKYLQETKIFSDEANRPDPSFMCNGQDFLDKFAKLERQINESR